MAGQDKKNRNQNGISDDNEIEPVEQTDHEAVVEEYHSLDSKLDELNSALDYLEQKNDDIHERLKELLQSNIEIRQELRNENVTSENN
ncbi:unnamed protein product [Arctia plantaginis]|uniref:Uncharacterized protein n=1 Tax=Arctia plantaginis TaxID=874455 RepID=A0A8S1AP78_ARCPL|nr:unnamed protein product [Arctia plantaginis]CAB3249926.1 unnamed protein product [Arctia plantaginis]